MEMLAWMCKLVESDFESQDWSQLGLRSTWPIQPPHWALSREAAGDGEPQLEVSSDLCVEEGMKEVAVKKEVVIEEEMKKSEVQEEEVKEVMLKESVVKERVVKKEDAKEEEVEGFEEDMTGEVAFPWSSWGSQLPPASPPVLVQLPTWRPWEPRPRKVKKRSPASEARSFRRLRDLQQRRDLQRASDQSTSGCASTPLPPSRELKQVRLLERLEVEGGKLGSQAFPSNQSSGIQTSSTSPARSGSQTSPWGPAFSPWSGEQNLPASPSWSGSQTNPTSPPWSGNQGNMHQGNWLPASTSQTQTMLQQPLQPLVSLPPPSPGYLPPPSRLAGRCTWGTLPALVTACPSCLALGCLTPN